MDPEKAALLFGPLPVWADVDDPTDRARLLASRFDDDDDEPFARLRSSFRVGLEEALVAQILDEDPPEVWQTGKRLLERGLGRDEVLRNLRLALIPSIHAALGSGEPFDRDGYLRALDQLPLPTGDEVEAALVVEVRARQPIGIDDLEEGAAKRLGFDHEEEPYRTLIDRLFDKVALDGTLEVLPGELVVEPASLSSDMVLTHRLSAPEREMDVLFCTVDLAGFSWADAPTFEGRELEPFSVDDGHLAWGGPDGWLERFPEGALLAVRVDADGVVEIEVLQEPPQLDPALVKAVRDLYDQAVEEPGLPVGVTELVLGLLAADRSRFSAPQAPLSDLIDTAGLELNGGYMAHDDEIWERHRTFQRWSRLGDALDDSEAVRSAADVFQALEHDAKDTATLRQVATALEDVDVLEAVVHEIIDHFDEPDPAAITAFGQRVAEAAHRPTAEATAYLFAALVVEQMGELHTAEGLLHLAVAADSFCEPAADRLGWYLSDRGRAAEAVRVWRAAGFTSKEHPDLAIAESFSRSGTAKVGRNDPCWCGSGRKYKHCHLGRAEAAPLADRVHWLCRKAIAYTERCGRDATLDVLSLAMARAGDDSDESALPRAMSDPLVLDLALTEGGWFERFYHARSALLPDDEAILAASWLLVDRSVYEVLDVRPGEGLSVKDLRSAEVVEVRERTFSVQAVPGEIYCARAVPDGTSHQFIGAAFPVRAGREAEVLDLLDRGDSEEIAAYVARLEAPPQLRTTEGEVLVECRAELACEDPVATAKALDEIYESDQPGVWTEMHPVAEDESILRATLRLEGGRLSVETMSEERMDRVLAVLIDAVGGVRLETDERSRIDLRDAESLSALLHGAAGPTLPSEPARGIEPDPTVIEAICERLERRWCDENIPALGGVTPRQAAADPSRREALERLLLEFSRERTPPGAIAMRPERLRTMLGI